MARFDGGWIKLHRKLLNAEWSALLDVVAKGLFIELLLMANYKSSRYLESGVVQILNKGQVLTSMVELSAKLRMDRRVVRNRLDVLVKTGTLTYTTSNAGTVITICNYNMYQTECTADSTAERTADSTAERTADSTAERTADSTAERTHNEEVKNLKKEKKEKKVRTKASLALGSEWLNLGQSWLDFALTVYPWQSTQSKWKPEIFGQELERVGKIMSIDIHGMQEILGRVMVDDFWAKNVASPFGLTSRGKNGNRKIDNLIVGLKTKRDKTIESIEKWANQPEIENDGRPTMLF